MMMTRYYFDLRDATGEAIDIEGFELPDLASVQWEAVLLLVDHSRKGSEDNFELSHELTIDVRDNAGPVMQVRFKFHHRQKS